jgi:hypothetical protein
LIDGPPEILPLTLDRQKHLIEMPLVTGPRPSPTQVIRIPLPKLAAPLANRLIGHDYATFQQYFFHIPEAQAKPEVATPHG